MTEATNPTVSYHTVAVEAQTTAIDANSSLLAQLVAQGVKGEPKHPDFIQIDPTWDSQCCNSGQAVGPQRAQRYRLVRVHFSGHANNTLALYVGGTKRYEIFMTLGTPIIVPFDDSGVFLRIVGPIRQQLPQID